jgi:hypothetical protein
MVGADVKPNVVVQVLKGHVYSPQLNSKKISVGHGAGKIGRMVEIVCNKYKDVEIGKRRLLY